MCESGRWKPRSYPVAVACESPQCFQLSLTRLAAQQNASRGPSVVHEDGLDLPLRKSSLLGRHSSNVLPLRHTLRSAPTSSGTSAAGHGNTSLPCQTMSHPPPGLNCITKKPLPSGQSGRFGWGSSRPHPPLTVETVALAMQAASNSAAAAICVSSSGEAGRAASPGGASARHTAAASIAQQIDARMPPPRPMTRRLRHRTAWRAFPARGGSGQQKAPVRDLRDELAHGRYWIRTSDLTHVKRAL